MRIKIFATGGTFDKAYDEYSGTLAFTETHLSEMLKIARCRVDVDIETIILMDSLYMQNHHRQLISSKCRECIEDRILITHGTDTMVETAKVIAEGKYDKTIVLTGAMRPYDLGKSDAIFNLGAGLAFTQVMPSGVYIAMNGLLFNYYNVKKNKA
ncbi:asparaginase, partial [Candidatus Woesearchaeota archaeon]|nr:asparaginase [Candidatus Woesearchaeota archaeon]